MDTRELLETMQGFAKTAELNAAIKLGIFNTLANGPQNSAEVGQKIGANPRGTRILLDALVERELLQKKQELYSLAPTAAEHLVAGEPGYLGGVGQVFMHDVFWQGFSCLHEAVHRGGTVLKEDADTPDHGFWLNFASNFEALAIPAAQALVEIVGPWAKERRGLKILDLGCSHGIYGYTLAKEFQARVCSLDWPETLQKARDYAKQFGVSERVEYIAGDMFSAPLGGPYDVIIASAIFHHFSEERCGTLLERLRGVLKEDGRLAIQDFITTPFARLFSVWMLVWTKEGEAHDLAVYERMLKKVGLVSHELQQSAGPYEWLIVERV